MSSCILVCEACGARRPHMIDEHILPEVRNGQRVEKFCPVCKGQTFWSFAFEERRMGPDRRQGTDRRNHSA